MVLHYCAHGKFAVTVRLRCGDSSRGQFSISTISPRPPLPLRSRRSRNVCGCYLRDVTRVLCAFLLLFAMASPAEPDDAKALTAILLVARAELPDSNFRDSVVLVMNNIGPAPVGVIINRPTRIGISGLFPDLEHPRQVDGRLYFGGPVEMESASFLFQADTPPEHALQVIDGVYFSANRDLLRKLLARVKPMDGLRVFVGHSGWGPGQLEAEIARGDWKLAPADTEAIFNGKSERPWPEEQAPNGGNRLREVKPSRERRDANTGL
jgi:putative transcriptional regulator